MVAAGHTAASAPYKCATKVFSQNPRCRSLKVGRRGHSFTQIVNLVATAGLPATQSYDFYVAGRHVTVVGQASTAAADAVAINTAIATALAVSPAITTVVATNPSGATVVLTSSANVLTDVLPDYTHMTLADVTTDAGGSSGIADDLASILAADGNWYGLLLDSNSPAEISATAAWVEANGPRLFITNCSDSAIAVAGSTTDIAYTLKTSAYARTALLFSQSQLLSYSGAAWMGNRFPFDPGSDTWAFKTLAGVTADRLNDGQVHAVLNKYASVYSTVAGLNMTQGSRTPSGEFIDLVRGIDWFTSELQINVFGLLANNAKIPFTDTGIDVIRSTILGVMQEGIDAGLIAASPAPIVTMPTAASVNAIDKANRNLPNVFFQATLAGAVHSLTITGTLSV